MAKVLAETLKAGDVIMPPAREVQLWMMRSVRERGLTEAALHLTVTNVYEAAPDKKGRWLMIETQQSAEWACGAKQLPFKFKARPETPWPVITA